MGAAKTMRWGWVAAGALLGVGCASDKGAEKETTTTTEEVQTQQQPQSQAGQPQCPPGTVPRSQAAHGQATGGAPCPEGMVPRSQVSQPQVQEKTSPPSEEPGAGMGGAGEEEEHLPVEGTGGAEGGGG